MSKALSVDLRDRVIAAIENGMSCRHLLAGLRTLRGLADDAWTAASRAA